MACGHNPGWPSSFAAIVSAPARSDPSVPSTREARRSNSTASSADTPRYRRLLCTCVAASVNTRPAAPDWWYFSASASAMSRSCATPVAKDSRMLAPGNNRIRCRRLTMGSRTTPVVPDSARPSRAAGAAGVPPRPRKRARSVSHSMPPCARPSRLNA